MRVVKEHDYTTYPRTFAAYKWYKPLLVGLLFIIFAAVFNFGIVNGVTRAIFGTIPADTGYDDIDFFTAAGAFYNGLGSASAIPCLFLAALIVKDRPFSSYMSSMGGWRWRVFLKTLAAAFVILGIPNIVLHLVNGRAAR